MIAEAWSAEKRKEICQFWHRLDGEHPFQSFAQSASQPCLEQRQEPEEGLRTERHLYSLAGHEARAGRDPELGPASLARDAQ